jgi:hypothetical protein
VDQNLLNDNHIGVDQNLKLDRYHGLDVWLDVWLRFRGSNRAEKLHQKMSVKSSPRGVVARTAHYVPLLVSYQFNVHAAVRRCNDHNFGHAWLHSIDQITATILNVVGVVSPWNSQLTNYK